jgi:hypothetical protein
MKFDIVAYVLVKMLGSCLLFCAVIFGYVSFINFLADLYRPYTNNADLLAFITPLGVFAFVVIFFIMYQEEEMKRG